MINLKTIPYKIENSIARRARVGLIALATDHVIEHELIELTANISGVQIYTTKVPMASQVTTGSLRSMEAELSRAAKTLLPGITMNVIGYGCTSAAAIIGEENISKAIQSIHDGVPVTTPITAAFAALSAFSAKRIGLLTPYIEEVNAPIRKLFYERGIEVVACATFSEIDDNRAGLITPNSIRNAVLKIFPQLDIDAIFISCTSLRAAKLIPGLESELGIPVTTSNHALAWHLLRLSGVEDVLRDKGKLFLLSTGKNTTKPVS